MKVSKLKVLFGCVSFMLISQSCTSTVNTKETAVTTEKVKTAGRMPEFSWDTMPLYMHAWKQTSYTDEEIKYLAQYPLITLEKVQGKKEGTVQEGTLKAARAIKEVNPNAKVLYYKNIVLDWGSGVSKQLNSIHGGYLQAPDGTYPTINIKNSAKFFDISKPKVQQWWIKDAKDMLEDSSLDGLFIDANIKVLVEHYFGKSKKLGTDKAKALIVGYHSLLTGINDEFREDNILIANIIRARLENAGLEYMEYFDGSYFEGFEHNVNGVSKPDYLVKGIEAGQKTARNGKILAFTAGLGKAMKKDSSGIGLDEARHTIGSLVQVQQRVNYLTAIFLIMAEKYSYFYPHDGYGVHKSRTWLKDISIFKNRLGSPKGPAIREGYVFTREFEYCSVYLNVETEEATLEWK
jgi:hypothetical protein